MKARPEKETSANRLLRVLIGEAFVRRMSRLTVFAVFLANFLTVEVAAAKVVYTNDFEGTVGSEWSLRSTDTTPVGARKFLGQFGDQTVTLSLSGLPAHRSVTISFELFAILSWDGNYGAGDIFDLSVGGGGSLLHTTFSNGHWDTDEFGQAYPDAYPGGQHPYGTGASELNSLGYLWGPVPMDSVYSLSFTFAHTEASLSLSFSGANLSPLTDESWGIDNVVVEICGDGVVDEGEQCDDDNVLDGDGCDSNCTYTGCGNRIVTLGEQCDDGNVIDGDGCDSNCKDTGCGNGIVTLGEQCDDGNVIDGDGCDSNCTETACGNGIVTSGEECDDGNRDDSDGCTVACTICGNGIVTAPEECDDANASNDDACRNDCRFNVCGDGFRMSASEQCDDGNTEDGDCCSSTCQYETGPCDDGNACTTNDTCGSASCLGNTPVDCDDGNACTLDTCDPVLGCLHSVTVEAPSCGNCTDAVDNDGDGRVDAQDADCQTGGSGGRIEGVWRAKGVCPYHVDVGWVYRIAPVVNGNVTGAILPTSLSFVDAGQAYIYVGKELISSGTYDGMILQLEPAQLQMEVQPPHYFCGESWNAGTVVYDPYSVADLDGDGRADVMTGTMQRKNLGCGVEFGCLISLSRISTWTPSGTDVAVELSSGDELVFGEVVSQGETYSFDIVGSIAALPEGSQVLSERVFADAGTTAETAGSIQVCLEYPDQDNDGIVDNTDPPVEETALGIVHNEGGIFVDRKVNVDTAKNRVCAETGGLSEFAVGIFSFMCGENPRVDCRGGKSSTLFMRKGDEDRQDRLVWRWTDNGPVNPPGFGDPTSATNYALCVYDASRRVSAVELYGTQAKWAAIPGRGYKYRAHKDPPGGIRSISLKSGGTRGVSLTVNGRGENLPDMTLGLAPPVQVQLISSEGGCWESLFAEADIIASDLTVFRAKAGAR
jgi:cysteine-rich repeat protein